MTITVERKSDKERKDGPHKGKAPLFLRITHKRKQRYLALGVDVREKEWDAGRSRLRGRSKRTADLNAYLARAEQLAADAVASMHRDGTPVSAEAVRDAAAAELAPERYGREDAGDFCAFARAFVDGYRTRGQVRSYKKMNAVLNKLLPFLRERAGVPRRAPIPERTVPFDAFTPTIAREFKDLLVTPKAAGGYGNSENTAAVNVRIVRRVCNAAIEEELMPRDPTRSVKLKERYAEKGRLSKDDVAALAALGPEDGVGDGTAYRPGRRWGKGKDDGALLGTVRDAFLFSLYLAGIRFGDLAELRTEHVQEVDGKLRLVYRMQKTDEAKSLPLVAPAAEIYERYRSARAEMDAAVTGSRLFPFLDGRTDARGQWHSDEVNGKPRNGAQKRVSSISSANALVNKYLKRLAELADVRSDLTFHMSRHSFADIARQSGMSVYDVSKALGHSSVQITERYLASFDRNRLDSQLESLFPND